MQAISYETTLIARLNNDCELNDIETGGSDDNDGGGVGSTGA